MAMLTFVAAVVFILLIVLALYVFGIFSTPYFEAFRFAFYLLLVILVLILGIGFLNHPFKGYEPTARIP